MELGIDVSEYQKIIDWKKVKASGIDFAMIRTGYGINIQSQIDSCFYTNIKGAQAAGIKCGVYHYSYAKSVQEATQEANFMLSIIKGYKLDYPVTFDLEDKSLTGLSKRILTDVSIAFCNTVKQAGYYPCIYTNPNWLQNYLYIDELKDYDLWLAQWTDKPTTKYKYDMWQYSDSGVVDGINGKVDMDISYKDYSAIINPAISKVKIDTTLDMKMDNGSYYTVKTTCDSDVTLTAGTGGVVEILPCRRDGQSKYFHIHAIGNDNLETGIYTETAGEQPFKRFVIRISKVNK